jgi:queuine tRNA-ribosyltransferase
MREMREAILAGEFSAYYERQRVELVRNDEEHPSHPTKPKIRHVAPLSLGDYEIVTAPQGFSSIRQISSGEVMHSVNPPEEEANRLYVEQSGLAARLASVESVDDEWVIWDVGLGAASNAMAAIHCFEKQWAERGEAIRRLRIVSFECDLDPLKLAVRQPGRFAHLRHGAPHALLKDQQWTHASSRLRWELHEGDFLKTFPATEKPDAIFYDPFSFKTDSMLWTTGTFARIHEHCRPKPAELYTYSAATAARVALLNAGFFVGEGVGSGPKADTTIAFTQIAAAVTHPLRPRLLGAEWLTRWRRSGSKFPAALPLAERAAFEQRIENHEQFVCGEPVRNEAESNGGS